MIFLSWLNYFYNKQIEDNSSNSNANHHLNFGPPPMELDTQQINKKNKLEKWTKTWKANAGFRDTNVLNNITQLLQLLPVQSTALSFPIFNSSDQL